MARMDGLDAKRELERIMIECEEELFLWGHAAIECIVAGKSGWLCYSMDTYTATIIVE